MLPYTKAFKVPKILGRQVRFVLPLHISVLRLACKVGKEVSRLLEQSSVVSPVGNDGRIVSWLPPHTNVITVLGKVGIVVNKFRAQER